MNGHIRIVYLFGLFDIIAIVFTQGAPSHTLCLDGKPPFKSEKELSFCAVYTSYGCCGEKENAHLKGKFTRLAQAVPSQIWNKCSSYAKTLLCQSCSSKASHLHEAGIDAFENKQNLRKFPRLCKNFCTRFFNECKDLVQYYIEEVESNEIFTTERQKLLNAIEEGPDSFCFAVELPNNGYCYPDSINKTRFDSAVADDNASNTDDIKRVPVISDLHVLAKAGKKPDMVNKMLIDLELAKDALKGPGPINETQVRTRGIDSVDCLCVEEIAGNLKMPVFLENANDGSNRLFIGEQIGVINIFYPDGEKVKKPFLDITSRIKKMTSIEQGLTGLAFHPNFASNGLFYVFFSTPKGKSKFNHYSNIGEFKVSLKDANKADPDYFRLILQIPQPTGVHNGGEILFGVDGYLYIFMGDGGKQGDPDGNAQNLESYFGKVLRIDVDSRTDDKEYGIPSDNPFQDQLSDGTVPHPEIYAFGLRNPWRCGVDAGDRVTGDGFGRIVCGDVGQSKVEEVDVIEKGANYGWNKKEGSNTYCSHCEYAPAGELKKPIFEYHRNTRFGKSVIGGEFYRGCLSPNLNGMYFFGDFSSGRLFRLLENQETGEWENKELEMCFDCKKPLSDSYAQNIISFGLDEDGEVYLLAAKGVSAKKKKGHVYRLVDPSREGNLEECRAVTKVNIDAQNISDNTKKTKNKSKSKSKKKEKKTKKSSSKKTETNKKNSSSKKEEKKSKKSSSKKTETDSSKKEEKSNKKSQSQKEEKNNKMFSEEKNKKQSQSQKEEMNTKKAQSKKEEQENKKSSSKKEEKNNIANLTASNEGLQIQPDQINTSMSNSTKAKPLTVSTKISITTSSTTYTSITPSTATASAENATINTPSSEDTTVVTYETSTPIITKASAKPTAASINRSEGTAATSTTYKTTSKDTKTVEPITPGFVITESNTTVMTTSKPAASSVPEFTTVNSTKSDLSGITYKTPPDSTSFSAPTLTQSTTSGPSTPTLTQSANSISTTVKLNSISNKTPISATINTSALSHPATSTATTETPTAKSLPTTAKSISFKPTFTSGITSKSTTVGVSTLSAPITTNLTELHVTTTNVPGAEVLPTTAVSVDQPSRPFSRMLIKLFPFGSIRQLLDPVDAP